MKKEFIKGTCCIKLDFKNTQELNEFQCMFLEYFNDEFKDIFSSIIEKNPSKLLLYKEYPYLSYEDNKIVFSSKTFGLKEYIFKYEVNPKPLNLLIKEICQHYQKQN